MVVLILGAGICGLGTALLLARDGHEVTILERDPGPVPDSPQAAWDSWTREGVAQFRQPHNFMPGMRDADLFRAGLEYIGTLTPVQEILKRPAIVEKVRAAQEAMKGAPPMAMPGPTRSQLMELVG